ncbi:hypothetical protein KM043_002548 [Ampulex compressa]|nr:hypothetical protein KM043_002548 [Ampulex compressa]
MQNQDRKADSRRHTSNEFRMAHIITKRKLYFIAGVIFQLAPTLHYCETLKHALKARKCEKLGDRNGQRQYYLKMLKEDQDVALLRVFECFLEAAPQQVLQMTILLKNYHTSINFEFIHQVASICSSLVSMGWAMASYHRSIRFAQHDKSNISVMGSVLQFLWHLCITVSRICSLCIVASLWPLYTAIVCICHWIVFHPAAKQRNSNVSFEANQIMCTNGT